MWKVAVFLCSDFAKRDDKNSLNLLSFFLFLYKDYSWDKNQIKLQKREEMEKTLFQKGRDISRVIGTLKNKILKLKMNWKQQAAAN